MADPTTASSATASGLEQAELGVKDLIEAGVHFGHQTRRWDPRMRTFIFTERNGIHIIDLQQTVRKLDEAMSFVREEAAEGGTILFVARRSRPRKPFRKSRPARTCRS